MGTPGPSCLPSPSLRPPSAPPVNKSSTTSSRGLCVNLTLPSRWEKPFRFIHTRVGGCAGVAWEDENPCFSCSSHSAWKSKGCGVLLLCACLPKILTLEERGDQGIESQEERQGKMLLHTEYSLLSLLHTQDGVVHHHGLFQVSGASPAPTRLAPLGPRRTSSPRLPACRAAGLLAGSLEARSAQRHRDGGSLEGMHPACRLSLKSRFSEKRGKQEVI